MQQAMQQVNAENACHGLPTVAMGIGLNTGEVVVGNIGSEKRAKYSIVGRHVNSETYDGQLTELGPHNTLLHSPAPLAPLDNVKIVLVDNGDEVPDGEIYAKTLHGSSGFYTLRFTSLSQEAERYLERIRATRI